MPSQIENYTKYLKIKKSTRIHIKPTTLQKSTYINHVIFPKKKMLSIIYTNLKSLLLSLYTYLNTILRMSQNINHLINNHHISNHLINLLFNLCINLFLNQCLIIVHQSKFQAINMSTQIIKRNHILFLLTIRTKALPLGTIIETLQTLFYSL